MTIMQVLGFFCSLLIGISLGLLGGGGSILTLPVLVYLLGVNPTVSTAYSLFIVGITSLIGSLHYIQQQAVNYRVALIFAIPSLVFISITRSFFLSALPDPFILTGSLILSKDQSIMLFFALIAMLASVSMVSNWKGEDVGPVSSFRGNDLMIALAGVCVGVLTGIVGIGGGFLIIPVLVVWVRLPMKKAVGTSLLIIALKSLLSFAGELMTTRISWPFLLAFTALSVLGILLGSFCSRFISGLSLRKSFGWLLLVLSLGILSKEIRLVISPTTGKAPAHQPTSGTLWQAPDSTEIYRQSDAALLLYGRDLIAKTSSYFGPKGRIGRLSNGMNCQNCHLNAGTKTWGNSFGAVAATYPRFRERSGTLESVAKRVSDCFERSLNGRPPDSTSHEMRALVAYILFVGQKVPKGESPKGSGIWPIPFLDRAANSVKGQVVFRQKCVSCHGMNGQGVLNEAGSEYIYPPLWGQHSYNTGAGLFRISRFAGYIKANMPLGATWQNPQLTDEEAWDLAAYINSQNRPAKVFRKDWPRLEGKPVDHPFGPFADPFPVQQHKLGPFKPIEQYRKKATG